MGIIIDEDIEIYIRALKVTFFLKKADHIHGIESSNDILIIKSIDKKMLSVFFLFSFFGITSKSSRVRVCQGDFLGANWLWHTDRRGRNYSRFFFFFFFHREDGAPFVLAHLNWLYGNVCIEREKPKNNTRHSTSDSCCRHYEYSIIKNIERAKILEKEKIRICRVRAHLRKRRRR